MYLPYCTDKEMATREYRLCSQCYSTYRRQKAAMEQPNSKKQGNIQRRLSSDKLITIGRSGEKKRLIELSAGEENLQLKCTLTLREMLEHLQSKQCHLCQLPLYVSSWRIVDGVVDVSVRCDGCCSKAVIEASVSSFETLREEISANTIKAVLCCLGLTSLPISTLMDVLKVFEVEVSTTNFFRAMDTIIPLCIEVSQDTFSCLQDTLLKLIKKNELDGIALTADGAWNHRREGTCHSYTLLLGNGPCDLKNRIVIETSIQKARSNRGRVVNQGVHLGTSQSMEGIACRAALTELDDCSLVESIKWITSDQDSSAPAIFDKHLPHAEQLLDPGHIKKNFTKTVDKILGEGQHYAGFSQRMGRFFMRIIKRAEVHVTSLSVRGDAIKLFQDWLNHLIPHYQRLNCPPECPCTEEHENLFKFPLAEYSKKLLPHYEEADKSKPAQSHKEKLAQLQKAIENVSKLSSKFVHGLSTCANESLNYKRTLLCPKAFEFWQHHIGRCAITAGTHNLGHEEFWKRIIQKLNVSVDIFDSFLQVMRSKDVSLKENLDRKRSRAYLLRESQLSRLNAAISKLADKSNRILGGSHKSGQGLKLIKVLAPPKSSVEKKTFACDQPGCKTKCSSAGHLKLHKTAKHRPVG